MYSNFKGKDDLFLAVLDAEAQRRLPLHTGLMHHAGSIEEGLRASAGEMAEYAGTTGVRGLFVEDADEFAVWIGTSLRGLASWGLAPGTRLAGIGSPARCTSPTRSTRCCWPARPAPSRG